MYQYSPSYLNRQQHHDEKYERNDHQSSCEYVEAECETTGLNKYQAYKSTRCVTRNLRFVFLITFYYVIDRLHFSLRQSIDRFWQFYNKITNYIVPSSRVPANRFIISLNEYGILTHMCTCTNGMCVVGKCRIATVRHPGTAERGRYAIKMKKFKIVIFMDIL